MGIRDIVDETAARELELMMENESSLYPMKQAIIKNLQKKVDKGKYDPRQAPKAWSYWVERGAREYGRQHGSGEASGLKMFTPATRRFVAEQLARDYETRSRDDEGLGLPATSVRPATPPGTRGA